MASSIPRPRASLTAGQGSSPMMKVPAGSRVVLSRRRNGVVRYVGKLVNESGEWYGVALDEPKGDNDGTWAKERYFTCPPNHGVFVRRKEIYCVKEPFNALKSPPSPITDESSSSSSNVSYVSTDPLGEVSSPSAGAVYPISSSTETTPTPLMKTFKGFRKQLDFISLKTVGAGRSKESSPAASPVASPPTTPTARSSLKPPSPFRRFASFSQELPTTASASSPSAKPASPSNRRQSSIPPASKPSPVRRVNSFRDPKSSPRLSSFQDSFGYRVQENSENGEDVGLAEPPHTQLSLEAFVAGEAGEAHDNSNESHPSSNSPAPEKEPRDVSTNSAVDPLPSDPLGSSTNDISMVDESIDHPAPHFPQLSGDDIFIIAEDANPGATTSASPASLDRTATFRVPSIDISALSSANADESKPQGSAQDADTSPREMPVRSTSFRMRARASSFRIPSVDVGSPTASPENSPSRATRFAELTLDNVQVIDDECSDGQGSIAPSPRDDVSEASAVSAPEPRQLAALLPGSLQETTVVESLSPSRELSESGPEPGERPLFFRRTNVGHSPMERRSSYSSFSSSPPRSPTSAVLHVVGSSKSSRMAELEREISAMRSSHENIVAVLRATNKQHAANVLELRAQVAALTEGNLWLERQLTAKGELVRELRELEQQHQRDSVSVTEVEKILEIKDGQIQTLEREMAQLRHRLARLEADKDSQLYQQFQHYEARRARDEQRINELRREVVAMCNERLELQSEVHDLKEMSLRFF